MPEVSTLLGAGTEHALPEPLGMGTLVYGFRARSNRWRTGYHARGSRSTDARVYSKSELRRNVMHLVRALLLPQSLPQKRITASWEQGKAGVVLTCAWMMGSTPSAEISSSRSHFPRPCVGPRPILLAASWRDDPGIPRNTFVQSEIESVRP
ncbi:hypothetical protein ARMSODRAFT_668049 [Armillaria solidipes]|uniref:Uncharacterized protein n=1 Tax=Armillaria solidipes TaxID=1076256 RepID=A0A2H3AX47_9AGAR|nr:hypothetical protein ARMSODRAFT_668049 [Armillaria solidipes]